MTEGGVGRAAARCVSADDPDLCGWRAVRSGGCPARGMATPLYRWCRGLVWQPRHAETVMWGKWCSANRPDHRRGRRADLRHPARG